MYDYHIKPKQPLIFRNGKPFGTADNALAETWLFPQPSTIAGAMKTAWAENNDRHYEKAAKKSVCGPLLTYSEANSEPQLMFTAPADSICLIEEGTGEKKIYRLKPEAMNPDEGIDTPNEKLNPVFLNNAPKSKPAKDAPLFWYKEKMLNWLLEDTNTPVTTDGQGITALPIETRTHVSINSKTQTAESGHLFQTAGLDFANQRKHSDQSTTTQWGWDDKTFGLACQFQEELPDTLRTIGGESRLASIEKKHKLFPDCPTELGKKINQTKGFRLVLVTPAIFNQGYLPKWIDPESLEGNHRGMKLRLHAVSVQRWQPGTSWDMAADGSKNKKFNSKNGKGMRSLQRLTPAGTVYWFEILNGGMEADGYWLTSISDQRENDGYGLTLTGVWNINDFKKDN